MYTINDLATMTMLSTRTLRNHIKLGLLDGEKVDGIWRFSEEQFTRFISDPAVKPSLLAKKNAIVYDFLADNKKAVNAVCVVLDLRADSEEANAVSQFFCEAASKASGIRFNFTYENGNVRTILSGPEDCVHEILAAYYSQTT